MGPSPSSCSPCALLTSLGLLAGPAALPCYVPVPYPDLRKWPLKLLRPPGLDGLPSCGPLGDTDVAGTASVPCEPAGWSSAGAESTAHAGTLGITLHLQVNRRVDAHPACWEARSLPIPSYRKKTVLVSAELAVCSVFPPWAPASQSPPWGLPAVPEVSDAPPYTRVNQHLKSLPCRNKNKALVRLRFECVESLWVR